MPDSLAALRRVLLIPRLLRVEAAYLAFNAVDLGTWVAVLVYAYGATGPSSVGLVGVVQLIPAALVAPFVATVAEQVAGRHALGIAYALVAGTMGLTAAAMLAGLPPPVVYAGAVVAQACIPSVRPLQASILPSLVGTAEQLTATNSLSTILEGAGGLVGPLGAGLLIALASPGAVLLAGAGAALLGCLAVTGVAAARGAEELRDPALHPSIGGAGAGHRATFDGGPGEVGAGVLDGFRRVFAEPGRSAVVLVLGARQVVAGAMDVLLVIAAIQLLAMGGSGAGYLSAAVGIGIVAGGASALALVGRSRLASYLLLGSLAWAAFIVLITLVPGPAAALVLLAAGGAGLAVVDVAGRTLLQRLTPFESLTAVFGVVESSTFVGLAIGCLVATPLAAIAGVGGAMATIGIGLPVLALAALAVVVPAERALHIPLREIRLLRRLRIFAPLPAPQLEAAARRLERLEVASGQRVLREGEAGDCFYVIANGRVRVDRGGREVATLGPGDAFGEIALLRRVPRTATVIAESALELYGLRRDDFLRAVTGMPQALEAATRLADARVPLEATLEAPTG